MQWAMFVVGCILRTLTVYLYLVPLYAWDRRWLRMAPAFLYALYKSPEQCWHEWREAWQLSRTA